ncbi:MAG: hypothetical protein QOH31_4252 [Verrucomicrobiota bacterium]|jgi:hypothetical protein
MPRIESANSRIEIWLAAHRLTFLTDGMQKNHFLPLRYGVSKEEFWESESVFMVPFLDVGAGIFF